MRKFYLLFAALFAYTMVATAGIKNLYKQDFELAVTAADAGWISPNNADGMLIAGDEFGKFFQFTHAGGGDHAGSGGISADCISSASAKAFLARHGVW